ncbi:MAG TPA: metallophosphoesterase [Tepidisphaeraceae bacterium]|jgi:DNA repair exonuclease SbcCD nuclease subunit|nr:metallophosphoesterase [Tepidisphaeraceae bacterium]
MSDVFEGILCIGDPHLCTWAPGYRKDEYPRTVLNKLVWALTHARENRLLPVLLGDLFHVPRDNANWLIAQLLKILQGKVLTVIGNHDLSEDRLCAHDSLSVLLAADRLHRLDQTPWVGQINGVAVAIGGTNNGEKLPVAVDRGDFGNPRWVFWISHHDILFPGYEEAGRIGCQEIPGVDLVINGHIHRSLPDVVRGGTTWCNPGNIARVGRSDATRQHVPGVLRVDVTEDGWTKTRIEAPYLPFEQVFYPVEAMQSEKLGASNFIAGLQSMQKFKTADGEGLRRLIEENLAKFTNERVKAEIINLMKEVLPHANANSQAAVH